jgi:hypothetical protein
MADAISSTGGATAANFVQQLIQKQNDQKQNDLTRAGAVPTTTTAPPPPPASLGPQTTNTTPTDFFSQNRVNKVV